MPVKVERLNKETFGLTYTIDADASGKHGHKTYPEVEAFFGNSGRADNFIIRQQQSDTQVDVLELSFSQVYDLFAVLAVAIGHCSDKVFNVPRGK